MVTHLTYQKEFLPRIEKKEEKKPSERTDWKGKSAHGYAQTFSLYLPTIKYVYRGQRLHLSQKTVRFQNVLLNCGWKSGKLKTIPMLNNLFVYTLMYSVGTYIAR